jgi:DNA-binding NarL/FixJ family response regulator
MADAPFPGGGDGVTGRPVLGPLDPTDRQLEVLELLAKGNDMPVVAKLLALKVSTARGYLKAAIERLDAVNAMHAVALAAHRNLINPEGAQ